MDTYILEKREKYSVYKPYDILEAFANLAIEDIELAIGLLDEMKGIVDSVQGL